MFVRLRKLVQRQNNSYRIGEILREPIRHFFLPGLWILKLIDPVDNNENSIVFKITIAPLLVRLLQSPPKKHSQLVFDQLHLLLYVKILSQLHKKPIESLEIDEVGVAPLGEVQDDVVFVSDVV